ncbi:MAG: Maf family nucleotide pyrophosphatase [Gammaproteobacteria bacterium]|nr:Maf family nucleotide pyrophosphatase [Gammaproteobacteria bacterium]
MARRLVLGSSSPYRRELLQRLHLEFECCSPDIDETPKEDETPQQLVERLSIAKARAVANQFPGALIIAGDQVAVCNGQILGKPGSIENARRQLTLISGQDVVFETGLCVFDDETKHFEFGLFPTRVSFRTLTSSQIDNYLNREPALNCAGSFKSEAYGIALTSAIHSDDPTALIGLPLIHLTRILGNFNVAVL